MKPVWPIAVGDIRVPHDEVGRIVSHPSARELPGIPRPEPELPARTPRPEAPFDPNAPGQQAGYQRTARRSGPRWP